METSNGKIDLGALEKQVAELIVDTLELDDVVAADIDLNAPLFGEGLSLDSIDALEIAFAIGETFGFKLRSDDEQNEQIFASVKSLARHIAEHQGN
jgi:acyl carrier protein